MKFLTCALMIAVLRAPLFGQTPPSPPPPLPKPIVARAPDFAQWTVTYEIPNSKSGEPNANAPAATTVAKLTVVTKTGDIRHEASTDSTGQKIDLWCKGSTEIIMGTKGGADIILNNRIDNPIYTDFSKSDFTNLDWIAADNYTGIKNILGKNCWVFKKTRTFNNEAASSADASAPPNSLEVVYIAYIDKATQLPVQLKVNQDIFSYAFQSPPKEMQTLPPEIKNDVWAVNKRAQALAMPLPKPF